MTSKLIKASYALTANTTTTADGATGGINLNVREDVAFPPLNSVYSRVFTNAELDNITLVYDGFPTVYLNETAVLGEDGSALLLASINTIALRCIKADDAVAATGNLTVNIFDIGTTGNSIRGMIPGDSIFLTSVKGWPATGSPHITIIGTSDLTNTKLIVSMAGHKTTAGTGYTNPD